METKLNATYVLYQNGKAVIVDVASWEASWLNWWKSLKSSV
jgi:hypothetical protein